MPEPVRFKIDSSQIEQFSRALTEADEIIERYRTLLQKYIEHVSACEGTSFIGLAYRKPDQFTDSEWMILRALDGTSDDNEEPVAREIWEERVAQSLFAGHEGNHG